MTTKQWENTFDAKLNGQWTRIRRILTPRGAHFEALKNDRWVRIDMMVAINAIAEAEGK